MQPIGKSRSPDGSTDLLRLGRQAAVRGLVPLAAAPSAMRSRASLRPDACVWCGAAAQRGRARQRLLDMIGMHRNRRRQSSVLAWPVSRGSTIEGNTPVQPNAQAGPSATRPRKLRPRPRRPRACIWAIALVRPRRRRARSGRLLRRRSNGRAGRRRPDRSDRQTRDRWPERSRV